MKKLKLILLILLILFCLLPAIITPVAWIGIIILIFGIYQQVQKSKGKMTFSKPWIIILVGFLFSWISAFALVEPSEKVVTDVDKKQVEKVSNEKDVKVKQEQIEKQAEQEQKDEEAARLAEEQRKQEEAARLEEQRKQEEAARLAEEQRKQEEAARLAEEQVQQTNVYYKNCSEARAAGAAPVHIGEPGYGKHLDRDGDGIGCDR